MKNQIVLFICVIMASSAIAQTAFPADSVSADGKKSFHGNRIDEMGAVSVSQLNQLEASDRQKGEVKLAGDVDAVCQAKGCWMTMKLAEDREMRVKFKDYGFFVPIDASGKTAIIQGELIQDTTSVDELRHYAIDGGMTEEEANKKITQPEIGYSFIANGVIIKE